MQGIVSDKTFHLKWNNHLQNLSQLFTTIYSSSALADVTLSCRDGTLKAHKLVLSACSPYFEQIFKDNPCQHPIVILKGIPFSEINLLVEFMYKGSVDVQEMDLQSLMHTAFELEIRGLAYEGNRDNASQLLNINLEYPTYAQTATHNAQTATHTTTSQTYSSTARTDVERLKQIHLYQQSMMRAEEMRRRRRPDEAPATHTAVNNILAAAAREMEESKAARSVASIQTEHDNNTAAAVEVKREDDEKPKKRVSIVTPDEERIKKKKMMAERARTDSSDDAAKGVPAGNGSTESKTDEENKVRIKVVQLAMLQKQVNDQQDESDEKASAVKGLSVEDEDETDSSDSVSDATPNETHDQRPHVCDVCELRFQRASHLSRHRLTHTGERPFTCGGCGRSFARSDKLRVHTKICERDDPTVDMANDQSGNGKQRENNSEVMSGMVRTTHRESGHLVFTPSGDVMLPPRPAGQPPVTNSTPETVRPTDGATSDPHDPPRRGRGRPRKTPLPLLPKIKKKRGRPPKTSLDMEGCVLTSGSMLSTSSAPLSAAAQAQIMLKRKRGRPPKNYYQPRPDSRPNENYNATNLPFGDFAYLTEMMYNPALAYSYTLAGDHDNSLPDSSVDRTIDVSSSESDDDDSRVEPEENVPPVAVETQIMTVGDCQIVKLPPSGDEKSDYDKSDLDKIEARDSAGSLTITPISTVGDCTIRPVDANT